MRNDLRLIAPLALLLGLGLGHPAAAAPEPEKTSREILVPFDDLHVVLEGDARRVLLARKDYEDLLAKARRTADARAPLEAILVSADYTVRVRQERAEIAGRLAASCLEDGLHTLGLDFSGVGLRGALLDARSAPIGLADDGRLMLFVEGKGLHAADLEMVTPLETTAARQVLTFQVPVPTATRMRLVVPGDVEVKSGAAVVTRVFDEAAEETRFDLLAQRGPMSLVMTLNSRLKRKDRIVVARSVLVDEITGGYERLHATVSLGILHRAVDEFRFAVPPGFEVTDVRSPLLAQWAMAPGPGGAGRVLEVRLREETTGTVVLGLSAVKTSPDLAAWTWPHLEPLDVAGHVAVVGLLVEDRLKVSRLAPTGLIPIDNPVLVQAIPRTVLEARPGDPRIRPVVAYYAPQAAFDLTAEFERPPARLLVTTNLVLVIEEKGLEVRGGFACLPQEDRLFALDFTAPAGWDVLGVTTDGDKALAFERHPEEGGTRLHVRFAEGVPPGRATNVFFRAVHVPAGWYDPWEARPLSFPVFAVKGAARDVGAIAVDARDDMRVRPSGEAGALEGAWPLDENEKAKYGLAGVATSLAYRYEGGPYRATLALERLVPRLTAETFSFLRIEPEALSAHYELIYTVEEARARHLALVLPSSTPAALAITGLDGVGVKEYSSEDVPGGRRWTALLSEARSGTVKLAVDFQSAFAAPEGKADLAMPLVKAGGVRYQSGFVAIEGSAELSCKAALVPRRVDVGELVDAQYQPGRRLLGAYVFVGDPPPVRVTVERHPGYGVPPAVVQRAELATVLSRASGLAQSSARFLLKTKDLFLEVRLPEGSTLWAVMLDGARAQPQREGDRVLVSLAGRGDEAAVRDLTVVYETPVDALGLWSGLDVPAPRLSLHAGADAAGPLAGDGGREVPVADLRWSLYTPTDYRLVLSTGSVVTQEVRPPELAAGRVASFLYAASGGIAFDHGLLGLLTMPLLCVVQETRMAADKREAYLEEQESATPGEANESFGHMAWRATTPRAGEAGPAPAAAPPPPPPAEAPALPMDRPPSPRPEPPKKPAAWALEGARSLKIDLVPTGACVTFSSLGADPRLGLALVSRPRVEALAWGLALAVLLYGVVITNNRPVRKIIYVVAVLLAATLVPVIPGLLGLALVLNGAFYAACLLIVYYPLAALGMRIAPKVLGVVGMAGGRASAAKVAGLVLAAAVLGATQAAGGIRAANEESGAVRVPPPPVHVPADAIILPYDPKSGAGVKGAPGDPPRRGADQLLVPYERFVELWNLAYPDAALAEKPPPAPYALAGAAFAGTLHNAERLPAAAKPLPAAPSDEFLLIEGSVDLDVYTDQYAVVPLPLEGGVLARADLDGKPAKMSVVSLDASGDRKVAAASKGRPAPGQADRQRAFVVVYVSGKGRHRLDLAVRMRLARQGGWRLAQGRLPGAPATALTLKVAQARTEVRLGAVPDRRSYETAADGQTIRTALLSDGSFSVQWRPTVSEGEIDQALTAVSAAALNIQEDQVRLTWALALSFRRGEREFFTVDLPAGYLVEKVEGTNVRGWEVRTVEGPPAEAGRQRLEVGLLRPAKESEQFTVQLWRPGPIPAGPVEAVSVPVVGVTGAVRHTGRLVIARSPLLDVRTVETSGATRVDLLPAAANPPPSRAAAAAPPAADESPLGLRPYQAYEFVAVPFTVNLEVRSVPARVTASVQTILRLAEREHGLESRLLLDVANRPIYRAHVVLPAGLEVDEVSAPGSFEWGLSDHPKGRLLTVYLASGLQGRVALLVRGHIPAAPGQKPAAPERAPAGAEPAQTEAAIPRLEVLNVERQSGDVVIQADPAYDVRAADLKNMERVFLDTVASWLTAGQRTLARLVLHYTDPDYAGRLALARRKARVSGYTVTNVRVTDRAIEETVLVDLKVREAGIREVRFRLPAHLAKARVTVPLLRQRTVEPVPGTQEVRFVLELQDEVMDELRVVVDGDRLLVAGEHEAPIPTLETGETERRYVALESAGRDEVVRSATDGLDALSRQQREWRTVGELLRGGTTQAFLVSPTAARPRLAFKTHERKVVETAAARIGLGQTILLLDSNGAYRAEVQYKVSNSTEQFLAIEVPEGAELWSVQVAGEVVKPATPDPAKDPRGVWVPLTKSVVGDLDYPVVLRYGGKLADPGSLDRVRFPLIRTRNINVERSTLDLYLPRTHQWFWFGDRMRLITEAGDYELVIASYWNAVLDEQKLALQSDNEYARVRASGNTMFLQQTVSGLQRSFGRYAANVGLATELSKARANYEDLGRQAVQGNLGAQAAPTDDNRGRLYGFSLRQHNLVTKNAAKDFGPNWSGDVVNNSGANQVTTFNDAWLAQNKLETSLEMAQKEVAEAHDQTAEEAKATQGRAQQLEDYKKQVQVQADQSSNAVIISRDQRTNAVIVRPGQAGGQAAQGWEAQQQPAAPQIIRDADEAAVVAGKKVMTMTERRRDQSEVVQRYQEKLQKRADEQRRALPQSQTSVSGTEWGISAGGTLNLNAGTVTTLNGTIAATTGAQIAQPAGPGGEAPDFGFTSLAVDLPQLAPQAREDLARRWTHYQFTTPRGDVAMTAWAASDPLIAGLKRVLVVALVVAAVLALRWVLVRKGLPARVQSVLATALIIAGGAGLFFGIFPIAGLVAVAAGIIWRIWQRAIRRREAARAAGV